jgi:hypothetical protein
MKFKFSFIYLLGLVPSFGTTVLTENFTYEDGPITSRPSSPWVNHSGTALEANVTSNVLSLTSAESEDVSAPLSGQPYTTGKLTAAFDLSFSILPTTGGSYFAHFKDSSNGQRSRLVAYRTGAATGMFRLGISNDSGVTVPIPTDLSIGTVYDIIMEWDLATNRSSLSIDGSEFVTDVDAASSLSITSFAFRQTSGIGTMTVDNLVVTHVPEPRAALLGGLGMLALLRRRRF